MSNFEVWKTIENIPDRLYFYGLEDTSDKLIVLLKEIDVDSRMLKIVFTGALSYRVSKEITRAKTLHDYVSLRGFQIATNSEYLHWFQEESNYIFENEDLRHYCICNIDNIIDIISGPPVKFEWVLE